LQAAKPGPEKESNWLPAPNGRFALMLRLYWPNETDHTIPNGTWKPPALQPRISVLAVRLAARNGSVIEVPNAVREAQISFSSVKRSLPASVAFELASSTAG
jgi:hypothetical protein